MCTSEPEWPRRERHDNDPTPRLHRAPRDVTLAFADELGTLAGFSGMRISASKQVVMELSRAAGHLSGARDKS